MLFECVWTAASYSNQSIYGRVYSCDFSALHYNTIGNWCIGVIFPHLVAVYVTILFVEQQLIFGHDPLLGDCGISFQTDFFEFVLNFGRIIFLIFPSMILYLLIFLRIVCSNSEQRKNVIRRAQGSFPMILNAIYFIFINIPLKSLWPNDCVAKIRAILWIFFLKRLGYTPIPFSRNLFRSLNSNTDGPSVK